MAGVARRGGDTWFAVLPLALVPWQVAQVPATTPVWLNVAGSQAVVRWQVSQDAVVTRGLRSCPWRWCRWQVAQVPATTPVWLNVAGSQAVVRWQVSHDAVVATWFAVLPLALVPLWQVAQVPATTLA